MSERSNVIITLGGPGAGKSTVSNIIKTNLKDAVHLKTGQIMRSAILKEGFSSEIEKEEITVAMQDGGLVKDQIVYNMLDEEIKMIKTTNKTSHFILDGFPRSITQLSSLLSSEEINVVAAFVLTAPHSIMESRCKMRNLRTDRVDDRKKPVEHRITDYMNHIKEIRNEMVARKIPVFDVDTCEPMEKMTKNMQATLKALKL